MATLKPLLAHFLAQAVPTPGPNPKMAHTLLVVIDMASMLLLVAKVKRDERRITIKKSVDRICHPAHMSQDVVGCHFGFFRIPTSVTLYLSNSSEHNRRVRVPGTSVKPRTSPT